MRGTGRQGEGRKEEERGGEWKEVEGIPGCIFKFFLE